MIADCSSGWHSRYIDLNPYAGAAVSNWWVDQSEASSGSGPWDIYFGDVAIVRLDGTVIPLYNRAGSVPLSSVPSNDSNYGSITNLSIGTGSPTLDASLANFNTTYYAGDHLGTAQMELASGGWPVWQGEFAPYGQEISPQVTSNHYKFTGQERDSETGLDHFQFRTLSSTMGRWMSPDPYLGSMDLTNPQSFNRYAYVINNPMRWIDPLGLNLAACYDAGYEIGDGQGGVIWIHNWVCLGDSGSGLNSSIGSELAPAQRTP